MIWQFLFGGIKALFASLWSRLAGPKPTTKEKELTHDLAVAKREEAAFVAPPRDKSALLERMRERADGR